MDSEDRDEWQGSIPKGSSSQVRRLLDPFLLIDFIVERIIAVKGNSCCIRKNYDPYHLQRNLLSLNFILHIAPFN